MAVRCDDSYMYPCMITASVMTVSPLYCVGLALLVPAMPPASILSLAQHPVSFVTGCLRAIVRSLACFVISAYRSD